MLELSQKQKKDIRYIGEKYNLKFIILHGSYARNAARYRSDLDIAVLGKHPITVEDLLSLYGELAGIFGDMPSRELDLKSIHKADPLFLYEVTKDSQLLYGDVTDYHELQAYAFVNFFDSKDFFRLEHHLINKFQTYLNQTYA